MKLIIRKFIVPLLLVSCSGGLSDSDNSPIVKVGSKTLYQEDLELMLPEGLSSPDSIIAAEHYIRQWISDILLYDIARKNVNDNEQIDRLVEKYRKSLTIFQYEEQLVKEKLSIATNDTLINQKRTEFLKKMEDEIYDRALKRGDIQFYKE
jgi:hypothetical protein